MTTRRSLFSFFAAPLAQKAVAQTPRPTQIDAGQVRGLPTGGDNWLPYVPPQVPNGTLAVFVLPIVPRKIEVYVNGLRQHQATELLPGPNMPDFSITGNTITFLGMGIPSAGDAVLVMATL